MADWAEIRDTCEAEINKEYDAKQLEELSDEELDDLRSLLENCYEKGVDDLPDDQKALINQYGGASEAYEHLLLETSLQNLHTLDRLDRLDKIQDLMAKLKAEADKRNPEFVSLLRSRRHALPKIRRTRQPGKY